MAKAKEIDTRKAATIIDTAEIAGVTTDYVRKVLNAERQNQNIHDVFMILEEGRNKLVEEVKKLVPFN